MLNHSSVLPAVGRRVWAVLALSLLVACGGGGGSDGPDVRSIEVTPAAPSVALGIAPQFTATAVYSDNTRSDVTSRASWSSGTTAVATIGASSGLAATAAVGTSTISAAFGGKTGSTVLTVTAAELVSRALSPPDPAVGQGSTQALKVLGTFTDGSTQEQTVDSWQSSDTNVATVDGQGVVSVPANATVGATSTITATVGTDTFTTTVRVAVVGYAYAVNGGANTVSQFVIGSDGALTALATPSVATGTGPTAVAVDPQGRYAYVANGGAGTVSQYAIGSNGALTPLSPATVAAGSGPSAIVVDATGQRVYVTNQGDDTVSQYAIGANGALTSLAPAVSTFVSAITVTQPAEPVAIVLAPDGRFAYVSNGTNGTVVAFTIDSGGVLAPLDPPQVFFLAGGPRGLAITPSGGQMLVAASLDNAISEARILANGILELNDEPSSVGAFNQPLAVVVTPDGRFAYAATAATDALSQYSIGATSPGRLTDLSPVTVAAGDRPSALAIERSGRFLYAANAGSGTVSQYAIGGDGQLAPLAAPSVASGGGTLGIAIAPGR